VAIVGSARDDSFELPQHVGGDVRILVLRDDNAGGGVRYEDIAETIVDAGIGHRVIYCLGNICQRYACLGFDCEIRHEN